MKISVKTRWANAFLFLGLAVFAVVLALTVYFWMRVRVRANGGRVDPVGWMQLETVPHLGFHPSGGTPV